MTEAAETTETVEKAKRERKNGQTRPEAGTKTGLIWDIADRITDETGVVATKDEVWKEYQEKVTDPAEATVSTQFGRWVLFHGYTEQVKAQRKAAKDAKAAGEADEKQRKADEKAAAKKKREDEKAAKKAEREAAKKAKEDAKKAPAVDANSPEVAGVDAADQSDVELPDEDGETEE